MSADSAPADGPRPGPPGPGAPGGNPLDHGPVLLLTGARLADGRVVDVRISGDRIQAVGTVGSLGPLPQAALPPGSQPAGARSGYPAVAAGARIDLTGYLLLPAPAEPHAHHDSAFSAALPPPTAPPPPLPPLAGALSAEGARRTAVGPPPERAGDVVRRVTEASLTSLGYGATAQRTHVRIGDVHGLLRLEAVLTARQALRGLAELQAVAVPRLLTGVAGADGRARLREALKLGADAVGGCPELDPDPAGYVQVLVEVALEFDCPLDLHTRAADPTQLARMASALAPLRPRVALGPCDRLASGGAATLRTAGIRVVCLPQNGSCCGVDGHPDGLGPLMVRELTKAQVPLAAGSGALRDTANPVGRADPLEAAYLLAAGGGLSAPAAYEAVSNQARLLMGLAPVRVDAGFPAELLAVRGDSLAGALAGGHSRLVVHCGRVVSRTSAVREFADTVALALPRQSGHH